MRIILGILLVISTIGNLMFIEKITTLQGARSIDRLILRANKIVIDLCKEEVFNKRESVIQIERCITPIEEIKAVKDIGIGEKFNERRDRPYKE